MPYVAIADTPLTAHFERATPSDRAATRRRWMARAAVFGGGVLGVLAMATPAMAWPAMGC